jgi:ribonucleoside-diphosphate reductase alpha chain
MESGVLGGSGVSGNSEVVSSGIKSSAALDPKSNKPQIVAKPNAKTTASSIISVVKRNGMLVPFRKDRIQRAVEAAFRASDKVSEAEPLSTEIHKAVLKVTEEVITEALAQVKSGKTLSVEGIQDLVEMKLMQQGHFEVARCYIVYRDEHKAQREDSAENFKVLRRDGRTQVRFNSMKIGAAIEKAFQAFYHSASRQEDSLDPDLQQQIVDATNQVTAKVVKNLIQIAKAGTQLHVELIQDEVERCMMAEGFYEVAKGYILYRAHRAAQRAAQALVSDSPQPSIAAKASSEKQVAIAAVESLTRDAGRQFTATNEDGSKIQVSELELRKRLEFACKDLDGCDDSTVYEESIKNFYEGIKFSEIDSCLIMATRARMEKEPNYSLVAARLLLDLCYRETVGLSPSDPKFAQAHKVYVSTYISKAIGLDRLTPELQDYDLEKIANAIDLSRDLKFGYLGLQTLYDRYLLMSGDERLETPQLFWMRVSMGLAMGEGKNKTEKAIEFYDLLSQFYFVSSTPTLFNSGTLHPQMSSCYLTTISDDLKHIFKCVQDDALLSKWAGGLGNDWTNVRATGSRIKGTNGKSQGIIPFLKVANDTAVAVNQGGKRKGAMCAYLETWHLDIEDFLELRKNTGDERRRTHDMNTANWIPDLFMKRVNSNGAWTLFSPSDVPDLHDLYGAAFEKRYAQYEAMVDSGEIKLSKRIEATALWRKMLSMVFETGHPWITFKDPSNIRSPQDHVGVVHSSNLCTEILLNTSAEETAVCNLGSVNLAAHVNKDGIDKEQLAKTVRTAVRMLDNVIDINFYPTDEAKNANLRHRPVGLGLMGFQDALYIRGISYASPEAVEFADESMELISYYSILASTELAQERGAYSTFKGSKWDRGLLPIDTNKLLAQERGGDLEVDSSARLDWSVVRAALKQHGMRNSNTMAIAPTATISNITGVVQSIEPSYKHLYAKSNLSGDFLVHNTYLVEDLKNLDLWDDEMIDDLKYFDGQINEIERIPERLKKIYLTSFEIEPEWIIECASRRQKWIDMGQSLNLYIAEPSGKKLHDMFMLAWKKGLKTTYYLRSLGATQVEKSTTDINRRGLQPRWMKNKSASSEVVIQRETDAEATNTAAVVTPGSAAIASDVPRAVCNIDGTCESCQ